MRTTSFKRILTAILAKDGVPAAYVASYGEGLEEFINDRLREAWEFDWWPELLRVDRRYYHDVHVNGTQYLVGDVVWESDKYWEALQSTTDDPATQPTHWKNITEPDVKLIPRRQENLQEIGQPLAAYAKDPRKTSRSGRMGFSLLGEGVLLGDLAGARVWLEYRIPPVAFSTSAWNSATAYSAGDLVYSESEGECYQALQAVAPGTVVTSTAHWKKVDFPYIFHRYVVQSVYADLLASDGQTGKSLAEFARAEEILEELADKEIPFSQRAPIEVARIA